MLKIYHVLLILLTQHQEAKGFSLQLTTTAQIIVLLSLPLQREAKPPVYFILVSCNKAQALPCLLLLPLKPFTSHNSMNCSNISLK